MNSTSPLDFLKAHKHLLDVVTAEIRRLTSENATLRSDLADATADRSHRTAQLYDSLGELGISEGWEGWAIHTDDGDETFTHPWEAVKYVLEDMRKPLEAENANLRKENATLSEQISALAKSYRTLSAAHYAAPPAQAFFTDVPLPEGFPHATFDSLFGAFDFTDEEIARFNRCHTGNFDAKPKPEPPVGTLPNPSPEPDTLASGKDYPGKYCLRYLRKVSTRDTPATVNQQIRWRTEDGTLVVYTAADIGEIAAREHWGVTPERLASGKPYPSQDGLDNMRKCWQRYEPSGRNWSSVEENCHGISEVYYPTDMNQIVEREGWTRNPDTKGEK